MAYSCSRTALVQSGYNRYNLDRDWMLLHVLWLQPSDVCAVSDWSFATWITFFCWLPFLHVVPRLLQGFAFLPSGSLPNKRFVLDPSIPTAQNDEKNMWPSSTDRNDNIPETGKYAFLFQNSGNLRCWLFSQVNLVMSNFWNRSALFSRF